MYQIFLSLSLFSVNCVFRLVLIYLKPCLGHNRCVSSRSNATIKLQLLPLTDGIIVLDTLQIDVEEKGMDLLYFWTLFFLLILLFEHLRKEIFDSYKLTGRGSGG